MSKLRDIDKGKLPELNVEYGEEYFKRIRKGLFGPEFNADRGILKSKPIQPHTSVARVQK